MQLDKEKELKREQERCRMLARQIARELAPRTVRLTAGYDLLEAALKEEKFVFAPEEEAAELLIVTDPEQADLTGLERKRSCWQAAMPKRWPRLRSSWPGRATTGISAGSAGIARWQMPCSVGRPKPRRPPR